MDETQVINILEVNPSEKDENIFWGFKIDTPKKETQIEGERLTISGWILGKSSPAVTIEILSMGIPLHQVNVGRGRPDVAKAYPQVDAAEKSGFATEIKVNFLPPETELILIAILEDRSRHQIARIHFQHTTNQHAQLSPEAEAQLQKSRSRLQELQAELERSRARLQKMQVETENRV